MENDDIKPLTGYAHPPLSAVLSVAAFVGLSMYYLPTDNTKHAPPPEVFVKRVFPEFVSVEALLWFRGFFALIGLVGFFSAWTTPPAICNVPYRPRSRAPRVPFTLKGWRKHYPFTAWSWNLLGISFALSTYVGYQVYQSDLNSDSTTNNALPSPWLVHLTLILWEISAPMTLLIGAVVKYALWPAQIKATGDGSNFKTTRALLQHNANVIMAVADVALLGGLPMRMYDIPISVLYGCTYVLFSWAIMMTWHGQGPAFLYFFMDTTIGHESTLALYMLLLFLMVFYSLFCGVEIVLSMMGGSIVGHVGFAFALCILVCRFRD